MLDTIYGQIWNSIRLGASPARSPFTMWQLASIGLDGKPQIRSLVLRGADEAANTLSFHTDQRSAKIAELQGEPNVALASLDLESYIQLRINGTAHISDDADEMDAMWRQARPHTLILYQNPLPPGMAIDDPRDGQPQTPGATDGFENFALVHIRISSIEYLDISPGNHRRALFTLSAAGRLSQWIAP